LAGLRPVSGISAAQQVSHLLATVARRSAAFRDGSARAADQAGGNPGARRRVQAALTKGKTSQVSCPANAGHPVISSHRIVSRPVITGSPACERVRKLVWPAPCDSLARQGEVIR